MKKAKSIIALALAAAMLFTLAACGGGGGASSSGPKVNASDIISTGPVDETRTTTANSDGLYDKIIIAAAEDCQDLSPWNIRSGSKNYIYPYFYESLFDYDAEHYYPVLAKGYTEVDDLHWDVEIYDYIKDSAGNPITADDVVYSYKVAQESGYFLKSDMMESIEKVDDYTVRFTWNKKIDGICELEWPFCHALIFSQAAYESGNFATQPIATGPYYVESFVAGSGVTLQRNENYWQTNEELIAQGHHSNVQTIEIQIMTEVAQQVIGLQNGTVGFSYSVPNENLAQFMDGGQYDSVCDVYRAPFNGYYYIQGNMSGNSVWSDINFRKAVGYGLDNNIISTVTSQPAATAMASALWSEYYDAWSELETIINTYDPELAAQYLADSSYKGEELVLYCQNNEIFENAATIVMNQLLALGINIKIETAESSMIESMIATDTGYDMYILSGGGSSLIGGLNRLINNADFSNGCAPGMLKDEKLFEMYNFTNTVDNCTLENMTTLMNYILDNVYLYVFNYQVNNFVYTSDIAEIGLDHNYQFAAGDCTYYLD